MVGEHSEAKAQPYSTWILAVWGDEVDCGGLSELKGIMQNLSPKLTSEAYGLYLKLFEPGQ